MANSKLKTILTSIISVIIGFAIGVVGSLYFNLPDSYEIPAAVQAEHNHVVTGNTDPTVIKSKDLSIHFLELGNKYTGDCSLIKVGDVEMLIDAGSKASSIPHIKAYLDNYVEGKLDYVVVTHAHEDHYAGFATNETTDSLFDIYEVGTIIDFGDGTNKTTANKMYANYIRERTAEVAAGATYHKAIEYVNEVGGLTQTFELKAGSGVYCEMLYHKYLNKAEEEAGSENDYSVCLQISYDNKNYLFTGDLEEDGEASLVAENVVGGKNEGMLEKVEVYKAGHHGSKTSSTEELMSVIKPNIVCVCCCAGSSEYTSKGVNQFPTQIFINNVYKSNKNAKIYVTTLCLSYQADNFVSLNGNIVVCAQQGENTLVSCSNNTVDLKDTTWFKNNRTLPELEVPAA